MEALGNLSNNLVNSSALTNATSGLQEQNQRFEQNVEEVADTSQSASRDTNSQDRALVEQQEIVNNFNGNARALEAANQRIGSIVDIEV